ncbi:MAG: DNA N-6-adenine-methyltransferase, partial [Gammaproteobacteria bacterium]
MATARRPARSPARKAQRDPERDRKRFEAARALWAEAEQPAAAGPAFDLDAAKERLGVLWRSMSRLDRLKSAQAREAGDLLIRVKKALPHGEFIPWMEANLPFSVDKARDLMNHAMLCTSAEALSQPLPDYAPSQIRPGARFVRPDSPQDCWTPQHIIEAARLALGGVIDLDPSTSAEANDARVKATRIFTAQDNGLDKDWHGGVWCNPPWNDAGRWAAKLVEEYEAGRVTAAILLVNGLSMLAKWFGRLWWQPICFARVPFYVVADGEDRLTTP